MGYFVKNRELRSATTSVVVPTGDSTTRPETAVFGSFRYNTDLGALEFYNGTLWQSVNVAGETDIFVDSFTGDGSTTTFSLSTTVTGADQIIVFVGSLYQEPSTYSITGASNDISFIDAPPNGESIHIIHNLATNQPG
jgi:hypothetical protein